MNTFVRWGKSLLTFFQFVFSHIRLLARDLRRARRGIPAKFLARDFMDIVMSIGMLLVLQAGALLVFLFLPQGKDVLLIVAEEVGVSHRFGSLIWLLMGIFLWSVVSEYASRYAIYVSDNSGKSLTQQRVVWRKAVQKAISDLILMAPYIIALMGLLLNYLQDSAMNGWQKHFGFGLPAFLIFLLLNLVVRYYFNSQRDDWRRKNGWWQRILLLPPIEKRYCERLHGIYNDYVFAIRKPGQFSGEHEQRALHLTQPIVNLPEEERNRFPQLPGNLSEEQRVPSSFQFQHFDQEEELDAGYYRWTFRVPNRFYRTLHRQLLLIVSLCLFIFAVVCFLPVPAYPRIGSPGLLILSFTCWTGLYIGVLFLDYAVFRPGSQAKRNWKSRILRSFSVRATVPILLVFSSLANKDHQIRQSPAFAADLRPTQEEHFKRWVDHYILDSVSNQYQSLSDSTRFYPITFVCAEGGALRTGAFAALTLSYLQDSLARCLGVNFKNSIYAFSGVSGGSLGVGFFNATACLDTNHHPQSYYSQMTHDFFSKDFLAPVIGKMFYGDILNLFVPIQIPRFDRAIALEDAWEWGYESIINANHLNFFSRNVLSLYPREHRYPAIYVNTTEVETGRQCWITNVKPSPRMIRGHERDLLSYRIGTGIRYSTMINFSTRFPLFSPAATVVESAPRKFHYVDGGYYENTGMATMKEVMESLLPLFHHYDSMGIVLRPHVLVLRFSEGDGQHRNLNFGNEISEVLLGIYNTRAGRAEVAEAELTRLVEGTLNGEVATLRLSMDNSQVPMNWVLSNTSLANIHKDIAQKWASRSNNELNSLFFFNEDYFRPLAGSTGLFSP